MPLHRYAHRSMIVFASIRVREKRLEMVAFKMIFSKSFQMFSSSSLVDRQKRLTINWISPMDFDRSVPSESDVLTVDSRSQSDLCHETHTRCSGVLLSIVEFFPRADPILKLICRPQEPCHKTSEILIREHFSNSYRHHLARRCVKEQ